MSQWTARQTSKQIIFKNNLVQLVWNRSGKTMGFAGLHRAGGRSGNKGFTFGDESALWRMDLRDKAGYRTKLAGSDAEHFSYTAGGKLVLKWKGLADGLIDVTVTVSADAEAPLTRWRLEAVNRSAKHTIWSLTFPTMNDVLGPTGTHRKDVLVTPEGFGVSIPDPIRQKTPLAVWSHWDYPNGIQSMAYVALVNGDLGFYLGSHDGDASLRRFDYRPQAVEDRLPMQIECVPENAGRAQKKLSLAYDTVMGLFEGDWYDAGQIHRTWATRQRWGDTLVARRSDIPAWSRQVPIWVRVDVGNVPKVDPVEMRRRADVAIAFRDAIGADIGAHLYQWHVHPFDTDYPDYTPRPGFKGMVRQMQDAGVHVMPYINARLFDMDNPDWIKENARKYASKQAGAKLNPVADRAYHESYSSAQPMAVMCAGTKYWQDKIADVTTRLVRDLDVDGVYLDQVGAAWPEDCADPSHGHPLRGGGWWVEGYEKMMAECRRRIAKLGKTALLTTECNADAYMKEFGGLLMVHSIRNHIVPLFPAVYGGRAPLFGRFAGFNDPHWMDFRIMMTQNTLWGCTTGWLGLKEMEQLLNDPKRRGDLELLKNLCALHGVLLPSFDSGQMLRPPVLSGTIKPVTLSWNFSNLGWRETIPTIWASSWKLRNQTLTAVANTALIDQQVDVELPAADGNAVLSWAGPAGKGRLSKEKAHLAIPAGTIAVIRCR
jgi:hypothetical protein